MKKKILFSLVLVCAAFCCISCDDDWVDEGWDGDWNDDWRASEIIQGPWYVDYVDVVYGKCPYYRTDQFYFYNNGVVEVRGDGNYFEKGSWRIGDRRLYVDFNFDGRVDLIGYIERISPEYLAVDFKDYDYYVDTRYYLEFRRYY